MSQDITCIALLLSLWAGWSLHNIASDVRALRKIARKEP